MLRGDAGPHEVAWIGVRVTLLVVRTNGPSSGRRRLAFQCLSVERASVPALEAGIAGAEARTTDHGPGPASPSHCVTMPSSHPPARAVLFAPDPPMSTTRRHGLPSSPIIAA